MDSELLALLDLVSNIERQETQLSCHEGVRGGLLTRDQTLEECITCLAQGQLVFGPAKGSNGAVYWTVLFKCLFRFGRVGVTHGRLPAAKFPHLSVS